MLVPTQAVRPTAMAQGLTAKPTKPEAEDCPLLPHQIQVLQAPHPRRRTPNHDFQFSFFFPTTFIFLELQYRVYCQRCLEIFTSLILYIFFRLDSRISLVSLAFLKAGVI